MIPVAESKLTRATNIYCGSTNVFTLDLSTTGDKYLDFTRAPDIDGYSYIGYVMRSSSYKLCPVGIGNDRAYYTIKSAGTSASLYMTPLYAKI